MAIINKATKKTDFWGIYTPYCYVIIIRGIGYRAFILKNDFINATKVTAKTYLTLTSGQEFEFIFNTYLVIRAGHTTDLYIGLPSGLSGYITKKDRKLVLISNNKVSINYLAKSIDVYRTPSIYTGRGLRTKGAIVIKKAGKKDKQKGKAF